MKTMKKQICFVVQRYGFAVNGGAELHCRQIAEHMSDTYDVTVLTTKAVDYMTWKDVYRADEDMIDGVRVLRFGVDMTRNQEDFDRLNIKAVHGQITTREESLAWCREQGPVCTELLDWLAAHHTDFAATVFFTYLYYPTVHGILMLGKKAILVPDAHDEPFLKMPIYRDIFETPGAIFYNTEEERALVEEKFACAEIPNAIGGAGVEISCHVDAAQFRLKFGLTEEYLIYVGRIDAGKNCDEMFRFWQAYKTRHPGPLKLVLMGKPVIPVPQRDDIVSLGFVSEEDKFSGIAGARLLLLPSLFESLSIVVLEAMSLGVPVLVNGACTVLRGHCLKSGAGLYYGSYSEFEIALQRLLDDDILYEAMRQAAPFYVETHYRWPIVIEKLSTLIEAI